MAAVPWAPDLPQCFLREGYSIQPVENVLRETMEVGPPKTRRRSTIQVVRVQAFMKMSTPQRLSFVNFFRSVLFEGTIPFALDDPDGVSREFYVTQPPQATPEGRGWRVSMQLEYIEV